jgi:hypothetical protein
MATSARLGKVSTLPQRLLLHQQPLAGSLEAQEAYDSQSIRCGLEQGGLPTSKRLVVVVHIDSYSTH